jgi:pSer/pThr/pTyr-binding forkhead associated (FHA) protein
MGLKLIDRVKKTEYPVKEGAKQVIIGREAEKYHDGQHPPDIKIAGDSPEIARVSRNHCIIYIEGGKYYIQDAKSHNGTFVNGEHVFDKKELSNGDKIGLGNYCTLEIRIEK